MLMNNISARRDPSKLGFGSEWSPRKRSRGLFPRYAHRNFALSRAFVLLTASLTIKYVFFTNPMNVINFPPFNSWESRRQIFERYTEDVFVTSTIHEQKAWSSWTRNVLLLYIPLTTPETTWRGEHMDLVRPNAKRKICVYRCGCGNFGEDSFTKEKS